MDRLKDLKESGQLTEYEHRMVLDMSGQVLEYIAAKYDNIREGVGEFMRGGIIETEASRIFDAGVRKGEARGEALGETRGIAIGETRGIAIGETRGIAIGETRGIAIGETRGIAIGEARGETRKSERTAIRLYARGDAPADIADILEVDIRQVQQWIFPNKG